MLNTDFKSFFFFFLKSFKLVEAFFNAQTKSKLT